jgi:peptide chain release factor subunit 1
MKKHKKGGWSQARFQRLRQGSIHSFFQEVLGEVEKIALSSIVLAGPGLAKHDFKRLLSPALQNRVVGLLDSDIHDEHTLFRESQELIEEKERGVHDEILDNVKREVLTDGLAVYGIDETQQALENGQVEVLLVEKNYRYRGWICERCQILKRGGAKLCYNCGNKTSRVDVIEELVEIAQRMGARVDFIQGEDMKNYGHIAALLRYR